MTPFQSAAPLAILAFAVAILLAVIAARRGHALATAIAAFGLVAALASIPWAIHAPTQAMPTLFAFTPEAFGFTALILTAALLILMLGFAYLQPGLPTLREEFPLLLLIATLGAVTLAASANFITLFLGLEIMTLAMIGLITYPKFRPAAEEAGLKYLILSGMSSAFILFGIGLIDIATNQLGFAALTTIPAQPVELAGLALIGVGIGFKLSVVPFHIWVPDIYAGAPAPAGAYVAVVAKIAVLAILIRILSTTGPNLPHGITTAMSAIAILSMLIGNLLALMQENLKRILGYSSIAHLGYLLVAILAAGAIGHIAVIFYLVTYALTMIAAFGVIAILSAAAASRDIDQITDLRALFWTRPALAAIMTLVLLSLAGIPPAIGFIAKMYIFAAGIHTSLWLLTATMIASSVIGLFYYLNIIIVMAQKPADPEPAAHAEPAHSRAMPFASSATAGTTGMSGALPGATATPVAGSGARASSIKPIQASSASFPLAPGISAYSRLALAIVSLPMIAFGIAPQPLILLLKSLFGE